MSTGGCLGMLSACHQKIPILGICLGMQTIAHFFGGKIVRAEVPVHGKVRPITHCGDGLFGGLESPLLVTRYHSLVVERASLPDCLEITATSAEGEIMGLRHKQFPVSGVQFHPEAHLTKGGLTLLENALSA